MFTILDTLAKAFALWRSSDQSPELLQAIPNDVNLLRQIDSKHETKEKKRRVQFHFGVICDAWISIFCQDTRMESMHHVDILPAELHERCVARSTPVFCQMRKESVNILVHRALTHEDHVWAQSLQGLFDGAEVVFTCSNTLGSVDATHSSFL
jgi:hypothetical protein